MTSSRADKISKVRGMKNKGQAEMLRAKRVSIPPVNCVTEADGVSVVEKKTLAGKDTPQTHLAAPLLIRYLPLSHDV